MNIHEAIFTRRSVRKFTGEAVSAEDLEMILKAGFAAPSAHNYQPWNFIVIKNEKTLEQIAEFHPYGKMLPKAGCGIIVCGDIGKQDKIGFLVADCSAAIQNILLAAHGLNLGAVWCGLYPVDQLTEPLSSLLNIPSNIVPVGIIALGHKSEDRKPADRYDQSKIHFEKW